MTATDIVVHHHHLAVPYDTLPEGKSRPGRRHRTRSKTRDRPGQPGDTVAAPQILQPFLIGHSTTKQVDMKPTGILTPARYPLPTPAGVIGPAHAR